MSCEELKDLYELYTLDLLEVEAKGEIDAHLGRGCDACRKGIRDALALNAAMLSSAPDVAPPAALKRRVMAAVGAPGSTGRSAWAWTAALAAAAMLMFAVRTAIEQRNTSAELAEARKIIEQAQSERELTRAERRRTQAEQDRMMQALSFLNQPETQQVGFGKDKPARGNIFVNPKRGVLLIASNLPALTPGRIFEMWVIPKGGSPKPGGLFQSSDSGTAFHMLAGSAPLRGDAIAVTIEPEAGSPSPTTTPIFIQAI